MEIIVHRPTQEGVRILGGTRVSSVMFSAADFSAVHKHGASAESPKYHNLFALVSSIYIKNAFTAC